MNSLVLFLNKLILFIAFTLTKQNEIYFRREHSISKPYGGILSIYTNAYVHEILPGNLYRLWSILIRSD